MGIQIDTSVDRVVLAATNIYNLDFGRIFQGRKVNRISEATETLLLNTTDLLGQAFVINVPDDERRFTVFADKNYVIKGSPTKITVSVSDHKIGGPNKTKFNQDPRFTLYFPGTGLTLTVNLNWYNYWVTATILAPQEVVEEATALYQKWRIRVRLDVDIIPKGEVVYAEVLMDDPEQLPTPMRKLDSAGDYDQVLEAATEIEGRRGVMVKFDATQAALGPGTICTQDVFIHKKAFTTGDLVYMHFGEHSDRGIYTSTSDYLQVGATGGKLDFTVYPDLGTQVVSEYTTKVTWKILKEVPSGSYDDTVSVRVGIPDNSGTIQWRVVILPKGVSVKEIVTLQYVRDEYSKGARTITPVPDSTFNEQVVNFKTLTSYSVVALPQGTVPGTLLGYNVHVTGITGSVVNRPLKPSACIKYDWDSSHDYYTKGGKITVEQLFVRRTMEGTILGCDAYLKDMTVKTFTVTDKLKLESQYLYDMYLHVSSVNGPNNEDPAQGYAPFDYYLRVGMVIFYTPSEYTFVSVTDPTPLQQVPNATTVFPTTYGLSVVYNHVTRKFYVNGVSLAGTNSNQVIGNIAEVPLPTATLSINNVQLNSKGQIIYVYGVSGESFSMALMEHDSSIQPVVDLILEGDHTDPAISAVTLKAIMPDDTAQQDMVIPVKVLNNFTHTLIQVTSIPIVKGMTEGSVVVNVDRQYETFRITMEFDPANAEDTFTCGDSPVDILIPKFPDGFVPF